MKKEDIERALDLNSWEEYTGSSTQTNFRCPKCDADHPQTDIVTPTLMRCGECDLIFLAVKSTLNKRPLFLTFQHDPNQRKEKEQTTRRARSHKNPGEVPQSEIQSLQ